MKSIPLIPCLSLIDSKERKGGGVGEHLELESKFRIRFRNQTYLPPSLSLPNPSLFHLSPPRSCCMRVARTIYIYIYIVERGWRAAADPPHNFFPIDPDSAIVFPGAEGELQLRSVLPAGEWESRKVLGRGTSPRRLSVQRARRILGGKILLYLSLDIYIY